VLAQVIFATEHPSTNLQSRYADFRDGSAKWEGMLKPILHSFQFLKQPTVTTWQGCEGRGLPSHPVWIMWRSRWYLRLNCLLQRVHEYGFSPATWPNITCLSCTMKYQGVKAWGNWSSYLPVCVYMCRARVPLSGQRASHSGQEYVSPSKWITRRCRSRLDFNLKLFMQSTHSNSPPCKHATLWTTMGSREIWVFSKMTL
jgi:hypothetical protein